MRRPESSQRAAVPRQRVASPLESAEPTSGSTTVGRPHQYVEFDTPPDPASQPVVQFPALAPPTVRQPRAPRRTRVVVTLPIWLLACVGILAVVVVSLMLVPNVDPWPAPAGPPETGDTGEGVIGAEGTAGEPGAGEAVPSGGPGVASSAGPGAGGPSSGDPGAGESAQPSDAAEPSISPTVTSTGPSIGTTTPVATTPPQITDFVTAALPLGLIGRSVTLKISNASALAQQWTNASTYVSRLSPNASVTVRQPGEGIGVYVSNSRVCIAPTDLAVQTLDPGEVVTVTFRINTLLSAQPQPGRIDDEQCVSPA